MHRPHIQLLAGLVGFAKVAGRASCDHVVPGAKGIEEIARVITEEQGKVLSLARIEASFTADYFDYMAEWARRIEGEILESDGRLVVGPRQTSIGLISRRSQMRATRREMETLDGKFLRKPARVSSLARGWLSRTRCSAA